MNLSRLVVLDYPQVHRLDEFDGSPGFIFNPGHTIIPETPLDNVKTLVDFVHEYSRRQDSLIVGKMSSSGLRTAYPPRFNTWV